MADPGHLSFRVVRSRGTLRRGVAAAGRHPSAGRQAQA